MAIALFAALAAAGVVAARWEPALAPIDPPKREGFPQASVERGEKLAAIGNCAVCHTRPGGPLNGGGLGLPTPFGIIHSTNITPDAETGIGGWSFAAFFRSMRLGVDREGRHLYPVFPYDHFTKVTEEDNRDLYAYLMTRPAVRRPATPNQLPFPFNVRTVIAGWKVLFFREGPWKPEGGRSGDWNRGSYLADALAHCGGCHTPRNALGAERSDRQFAGGDAEGWVAYPINEQSPAPVHWTVEALHHYLRYGWHVEHGISRGPMAPVTANLRSVDDADVRAIAIYVGESLARAHTAAAAPTATTDREAEPSSESQRVTRDASEGARLYAAACASCHDGTRPLPFGGLDLHLSTAVHAADPTNIANVVLYGLMADEGERGAMMPAFGATITDGQLVVLLTYLRRAFAEKKPAWSDLPSLVARQRENAGATANYRTDGQQAAPWRASEQIPQ